MLETRTTCAFKYQKVVSTLKAINSPKLKDPKVNNKEVSSLENSKSISETEDKAIDPNADLSASSDIMVSSSSQTSMECISLETSKSISETGGEIMDPNINLSIRSDIIPSSSQS